MQTSRTELPRHIEYELSLLGVVARPTPQEAAPKPHVEPWKPSYRGEEPPF